MGKVQSNSKPSLVVAIGASAGGLEALEKFFDHCPVDMGYSYVVIQHLSSNYKSMMDELLSRHSNMPISIAKDGAVLEKNNIYLIPVGALLSVHEHKFCVVDKPIHSLTLPIDIFFNSLAEDSNGKSVAIILSGTGADGAIGISRIKKSGGMVIVQNPEQAKFDGMPNSAIHTGLVDEILYVEQIPALLKKLNLSKPLRSPFKIEKRNNIEITAANAMKVITDALLGEFNIDFSQYKNATVSRHKVY